MKLINKGKTKDVYEIGNEKYLLKFKDDMTGKDGVFDPGANEIGLAIEGMGISNLRVTKFFFEILENKGIPTHYVDSDIESSSMVVEPADMFGKGLEVICRYKAVGSFMRRYGLYAKEGQSLNAFVEFTIKDDERNDPPITEDALCMLGILTREEYAKLKELTVKASNIIKEELEKRGIELWDIKLEFGKIGKYNRIALIDEISSGSMRAYKDGKRVEPLELEKILLEGNYN